MKKITASFIEARENYRQHLDLNSFGNYKIIDYKTTATEDIVSPLSIAVAIQSDNNHWKAYEKPTASVNDITIAELNRVAATGNKIKPSIADGLFPMLNIDMYEY